MITLNLGLGTGISYDPLQRQVTSQCATIMQQIGQYGVYIPENMTHNQSIQHVFAMDNLDWKNEDIRRRNRQCNNCNIIVENIGNVTSDEDARRFMDVSILIATACRIKTLSCISNTTIPMCYISVRYRSHQHREVWDVRYSSTVNLPVSNYLNNVNKHNCRAVCFWFASQR